MTSENKCEELVGRIVRLWTCTSINPSGASYGVVLSVSGSDPIEKFDERRPNATAQEMVLRAVIRGLDETYVRYGPSVIYCRVDAYVGKHFKLVPQWRQCAWRNKAGKRIEHAALWQELWDACQRHLDVDFDFVDWREEAKSLARFAEAPTPSG